MRKYELGHMELVNSQEGKKTCYCLPHPVFKEKGSKTKLGLHLVEVPSSNGTQQILTLLQTAGLQLRKWASNHSALLDNIPKQLQETQPTLSLDNEDGVTTLGLLWDPTNDQLQVKSNFSKVQLTNSTASTKHKVLATTAVIFDSLGLLSPAVIAYKIFLQKLWQDQMQWYEPLPIHLQQEWNQLCQTIPNLSQIKINRKVICSYVTSIQLHGFCDSSEHAYGACLYIRSTDIKNKSHCQLLCSTSKVAPLKQLTIPRLELCAATLLSKLYKKATCALNLKLDESYCGQILLLC
jgi:hypothetical protein